MIKNSCALLLLVVVNVSADFVNNLAVLKLQYIKEVAITNTYIQRAFDYNDVSIGNGLEYVINAIVERSTTEISTDKMNFMIAVPERAPAYDLFSLAESIGTQTFMQTLIIGIGIHVPTTNGAIGDFGELNLTQFGEVRRRLTRIALKNLMRPALDVDNMANLIEARRILPTESIQNRIVRATDRSNENVFQLRMCKFIALFMSTKFPATYTKVIRLGPNSTCILNDGITPFTTKTYRKIEGVWWQVRNNDIYHTEQLLKNQL